MECLKNMLIEIQHFQAILTTLNKNNFSIIRSYTLHYKYYQAFKMQQNEALTKMCENCGHGFSLDKIDLHEAYCCRNFRKCEVCGSMVDRNYMENHRNEFHTNKQCQYCHAEFSPHEQEGHLIVCQSRPVICRYCENCYQSSLILIHENTCGSRTKECVICNRLVPMKELDGHLVRCARRRERRENSQNPARVPPPQNQGSSRHLYRQNSSNDIPLQRKKKESSKERPRRIEIKNRISPQKMKQAFDPVPISIQIAIKQKEGAQRNKEN